MIRTSSIGILMAAALALWTPDAGAAATQPAAGVPAGPAAVADSNETRILVDECFPAQDLIRQAQRLEGQQKSPQAIQKYQEAIDQYGAKLIAVRKDNYIGIMQYVQQQLLALPSVQAGAYDQAFGLDAEKLIAPLIEQRQMGALLQVCERYFPSKAAFQGSMQCAEWFFERGHFAAASRLWRRLLAHPMAKDLQPLLLHHLALAEKIAGRGSESARFQKRLETEFPDATGPVNGQQVPLADNLKTLLAQAGQMSWSPEALAPDEWPMFQGSPSHSRLTDVNLSLAPKRWESRHGEDLPEQLQRGKMTMRNGRVWFYGYGPMPQGDRLESLPVVSGGDLFFHSGASIIVRSASGGQERWAFPENPPRIDPDLAKKLTGSRAVAHDSCSIFGGTVFAVLPTGTPRNVVHLTGAEAYCGEVQANRLVALARTAQPEGRQLLWEKSGTEIAHDLEKDFPRISQDAFVLAGAPVVTSQGLYVMARQIGAGTFTQLYLLHLDRETGRTLWGRFLCTYSSASYFDWMDSVPLLSVADDMVFVGTGLGVDAAVDANDGHLVWLAITESAKGARPLRARIAKPYSWQFNPPLVAGDKVITAEPNVSIRVYERDTGNLVRSLDLRQVGKPPMVLGVVGNALITLGDRICATDIDSGAPAWPAFTLNPEYGKVAGRPFLAANILYVSFEKGLLTFDHRRGAALNFSAWAPSDRQRPGMPGNLVVTAQQIIVANDATITSYSNKENQGR